MVKALKRKKKIEDYIWEKLLYMPGALILVTDESFVLAWANRYFYEYFDCQPEKVAGQPMYSFLGEDLHGDMNPAHIQRVLQEGYIWDYPAQTSGSNGEFVIIRWNQYVFKDDNDKCWILSLGIPPAYEEDDYLPLKSKAVKVSKMQIKSGSQRKTHLFSEVDINPKEEADISRKLDKKIFVMHYQPRVNTRTKNIIGAEALIRMTHPERGLLYPPSFLPIAEKTGQITEIGTYVIDAVCKKLRDWKEKDNVTLSLSMNLSSKQLNDDKFVQNLLSVVMDNSIDPSQLMLEITERIIAANFADVKDTMQKLQEAGFKLTIDDYSTEFLSLPQLAELPADNITINRAFLAHSEGNPASYPIMESIILLAHGLNMTVTAGGVENRRQLEFLINNSVDFLQGYLFSAPMPEVDFDRFIRNNPDFYTRHI